MSEWYQETIFLLHIKTNKAILSLAAYDLQDVLAAGFYIWNAIYWKLYSIILYIWTAIRTMYYIRFCDVHSST